VVGGRHDVGEPARIGLSHSRFPEIENRGHPLHLRLIKPSLKERMAHSVEKEGPVDVDNHNTSLKKWYGVLRLNRLKLIQSFKVFKRLIYT
jgi:hypothetical protein